MKQTVLTNIRAFFVLVSISKLVPFVARPKHWNFIPADIM
jgi:hypothetical protein